MRIYEALAESPSTLPEGTIRGMYTWAKKHKNVDLLASLVQRKDLPADLLAELAKMNAAKVRVAYLSREDVDATILSEAVKKEKRVSVHVTVATSSLTPVAVLEVLGEIGTSKVQLALLGNPNTPEKTLAIALRKLWVSKDRGTYDTMVLLREYPHLHNVTMMNLDSIPSGGPATYHYLDKKAILSEQLTDEAELKLVNAIVIKPIVDATEPIEPRHLTYFKNAFSTFMHRLTLAEETLQTLEATLNSSKAAGYLGATTLSHFKAVVQRRMQAATVATKVVELLHQARVATSAEEVDALLIQTLKYITDYEGLVLPELTATLNALSLNIHASEATIASLIPNISTKVVEDLVKRHSTSTTIMTAIFARFEHYLTNEYLTQLEDPSAAMDNLAKFLAEEDPYNRSHPHYIWHRILDTGYLTEAGLVYLPWQFIEQTNSWLEEQRSSARQGVENLLERYLGDNPAIWEVFATLADGSDKTLGELLDTTHLLAEGI